MRASLLISESTPVELGSFLRTCSTFSSSSPSADSALCKAQNQHTTERSSIFSWAMNSSVPEVVICPSEFIPYILIALGLTSLSVTPPFKPNSCVKALISSELVMPSFFLTPSPFPPFPPFRPFPPFPPFPLFSTLKTLNSARCLFS